MPERFGTAQTAPSDSQPALTENSHLGLRPLTIVADRDEFIIGDAALGRFFAVPNEGVEILRALREGTTISEAAARVSAGGAEVDALEFVQVLLRAGFVTEVDGVPVSTATVPAELVPFSPFAARVGRLIFSPSALAASGVLLVLIVATLYSHPALRPSFEDLFVDPQPAVSIAILFALSLSSGVVHELCHWWAARSLGVPARMRLGRRLYLPVMETDVSGVWALPARLRYGPFLAGMMVDVLLFAAAVGMQWAWSTGLMDVPPTLVRICGALAVLKLFTLMFQSLVFLRTDLYAVLVTALGARNLRQVNQLRLKQGFLIASAADRAELRAAHPRDLALSRWYTLLYVLGVLWAVWFFKTWFYPSTFVVITWMGATLRNAPLGSGYWWQAAVIAVLLSSNIVWPLVVFMRERRVGSRDTR